MRAEKFVEEVLKAISKEAGEKAKVDSINQLVEVEEEKKEFKTLFFFNRGNSFGVVKCRGRISIFRDIQSILSFKEELKKQIEKKLELMEKEPAVVFETSLCLN